MRLSKWYLLIEIGISGIPDKGPLVSKSPPPPQTFHINSKFQDKSWRNIDILPPWEDTRPAYSQEDLLNVLVRTEAEPSEIGVLRY